MAESHKHALVGPMERRLTLLEWRFLEGMKSKIVRENGTPYVLAGHVQGEFNWSEES